MGKKANMGGEQAPSNQHSPITPEQLFRLQYLIDEGLTTRDTYDKYRRRVDLELLMGGSTDPADAGS